MKPAASPVLTDTQKSCVELIGRDICVTAGAGSGKTRILVERFVYLVNKRNCLLYTSDAADEN